MGEVSSWGDMSRQAVMVSDAAYAGLEVAVIEEDLGSRPVWTAKAPHHRVLVHLDGDLAANDTRPASGPVPIAASSAGGVWMVPAGQRLDSLPRGGVARFCEFRLSTQSPDCEAVEILPQSNIRDGLLYEAALIFERDAGKDELSRISSRHLLEAIQWHIIDRYDLNQAHRAVDPRTLPASAKGYVVNYINEMLGNRITLEDLAHAAALDVHVFLKRFYASFGTTPAQYIVRVRIERAKTMLLSSSLPVSDIAGLTGFNSPSHFCVSFMKHVGIAPLAFRQARR